MKLVSIDFETTGLDASTCSVLEIGAVVFDPDPTLAKDGVVNEKGRRWQSFECLISHKRIQGDTYALAMNADILAELSGRKDTHIPIYTASRAVIELKGFLESCGVSQYEPATIVGKNYDAFDAQFATRLPGWDALVKPLVKRRTLDVGSLCFRPGDGEVVNLTKCLSMLGIEDTVSHRALDDALQVATVVTRFFN